MRLLISGASGLIGSALVRALPAGWEVARLVRRSPGAGEVRWDPDGGTIDVGAMGRIDAAVHLAGESIAGRWSEEKKQRIRNSRVQGTSLLARTLAGMSPAPGVLLSASAVGIYGDRGDEVLTEDSPPGTGFLPEVGRAWEQAAQPAAEAGIRVVCLRMGVVLAREGGALARMLPLFRLGLGARLGSGRQWMSWIALADATAAMLHLLQADSVSGPVNLTAPNPVTNREFTLTLARVLRRPALLSVPALALRVVFGEMADEALLASTRVVPRRLLDSGFSFQHAELEAALRAVLQSP